MYNKLILACLSASFLLSFPYYGDGGEKVAFSVLAAAILISCLFKSVRQAGIIIPVVFVGAITWMGGQTTEVYTRFSYVNLLLSVVAIKLISDRITLSVRDFGKYMTIFLVLNSALLVAQEAGATRYLMTDVYPSPCGFLQFPWVVGVVAAASIPLIWEFSPIAVITALPMIFYSRSLICAAVAVLSVMYMVGLSGKFFIAALSLSAIFMAVFLIYSDRNIDEHRFIVWQKAAFYSKDPVMGNGIGSWAHKGFRRDVNGIHSWWRWAHNEPYQVAFENGLVGLFLFGAYFLHLIKVKEKSLRGFVFCLAILMFFHAVFHSGKLALFMVLSIAIVESHIKRFNFEQFMNDHVIAREEAVPQ